MIRMGIIDVFTFELKEALDRAASVWSEAR